MKEEHKVWIRGVNGRGDKVIKALEERGAKNGVFWECNREELLQIMLRIRSVERISVRMSYLCNGLIY